MIDAGVAADLDPVPGLLPRKVGRGTADFTQGPAMTREQAHQALKVGLDVARDLVAAGNRCLVTGDMGIANTTASAALICAFTGLDPAVVTGRGTGSTRTGTPGRWPRSAGGWPGTSPTRPIRSACWPRSAASSTPRWPDSSWPPRLAGAGHPGRGDRGRGRAGRGRDRPGRGRRLHRGPSQCRTGHAATLGHLRLRPLVDLDLRLGEGTGALLALPLVQSAARALRDVATFDSAGVTDK